MILGDVMVPGKSLQCDAMHARMGKHSCKQTA